MANLLEINGITKTFPGTVALNDVSFGVVRGEIHAIIGENGAGKSTLMKILSGAYTPDSGSLTFDGETYSQITPALADKLGIRIVYQELNQVPELTVSDNINLGQERFFLHENKAAERALEILSELGINDINPRIKIKYLSIGRRQLIEIAKATSAASKLIIMDEPTSSLTENETNILFRYIEKLRAAGNTFIYISHKLDEIMKIADRITILRDGCHIETDVKSAFTIDNMVQKMVNRKMENLFPPHDRKIGETILEVKNIRKPGLVNDVSFNLRRGEILGFIGLMGCGRTELFNTLFGVNGKFEGEVIVEGKKQRISSIKSAIKSGFGYVTEDRKKSGIVGTLNVVENITLVNLHKMLKLRLFTDSAQELQAYNEYKDKLNIKTPSGKKKIIELSGGNQQKVIISKWMLKRPRILVADEPTRGIDVGSKYEIYEILNSLAEQGYSIIFISSETEEIVNICDRAVIMSHKKTIAELSGEELTADNILQICFDGELKHEHAQ